MINMFHRIRWNAGHLLFSLNVYSEWVVRIKHHYLLLIVWFTTHASLRKFLPMHPPDWNQRPQILKIKKKKKRFLNVTIFAKHKIILKYSRNGHFPLDSVLKILPQKEISWNHPKIYWMLSFDKQPIATKTTTTKQTVFSLLEGWRLNCMKHEVQSYFKKLYSMTFATGSIRAPKLHR